MLLCYRLANLAQWLWCSLLYPLAPSVAHFTTTSDEYTQGLASAKCSLGVLDGIKSKWRQFLEHHKVYKPQFFFTS